MSAVAYAYKVVCFAHFVCRKARIGAENTPAASSANEYCYCAAANMKWPQLLAGDAHG
jgi:hypothetical protein